MKLRRWKKYRLSKQQFPTYVTKSSQGKGSLVIGRETACRALRDMLGRDVSGMKATDTRGEWVFMELLPQARRDL